MHEYRYHKSCVGFSDRETHAPGGLVDMIDNAKEITRGTFMKNVDADEMRRLQRELGYVDHHKQGLTMAADWHVTYHRSKLFGNPVYYFRWSAIEYIFTLR